MKSKYIQLFEFYINKTYSWATTLECNRVRNQITTGITK